MQNSYHRFRLLSDDMMTGFVQAVVVGAETGYGGVGRSATSCSSIKGGVRTRENVLWQYEAFIIRSLKTVWGL